MYNNGIAYYISRTCVFTKKSYNMKLAYIYPERLPSNLARCVSVLNTCAQLFKLSPAMELITTTEFDGIAIERDFGFQLPQHNIRCFPKQWGPVHSNKIFHLYLKRWLKRSDCDVLYTRHLKTAVFLLKHKRPHQKLIFEAHQLFYTTSGTSPKKVNKLKNMEAYVYSQADGITLINHTLQNLIKQHFSLQQPSCILYNGITPNKKVLVKDFSNINDFYYVGNLLDWKGVDLLLSIMPDFPDFTLHIVGGDVTKRIESYKSLAKQLGIEQQVVFHGHKSPERVQKLLSSNAKLTFIPNRNAVWSQYSMPLKLLEYMNHGNIVIASDLPTIQELCTHKQNIYMFKADNAAELKKCINQVLSSSNSQLQQISKNAQNLAHKMSWQQRAEQLITFCRSINTNTH